LINPFFSFLGQKGKVDKDKEASKRVKDRESGVARGIDFQFVANVINFDFPKVSPPFFLFIIYFADTEAMFRVRIRIQSGQWIRIRFRNQCPNL
jgi:hypothetical protein